MSFAPATKAHDGLLAHTAVYDTLVFRSCRCVWVCAVLPWCVGVRVCWVGCAGGCVGVWACVLLCMCAVVQLYLSLCPCASVPLCLCAWVCAHVRAGWTVLCV